MNQSIEQDFEQEPFMPGDELHDEDVDYENHMDVNYENHIDVTYENHIDVNYENHIVLDVETLNLVTKETSDTTDQEEGLEKHSDLPANLTTVESDATCPTCRFECGLTWKAFPVESTVKMVHCATHEYVIEQDKATLRKLHRTGYLLGVKTTSIVLSTNLNARKALHWAAKKGCLRELIYLLVRGVNPSAIDKRDRSEKRAALHHAARGGFDHGVDVLIRHGADVRARDAKSWTPLHHAASGGHYWITAALLTAGASLHLRNSFQEMPLNCAARDEDIYAIELLLDWGADKLARDKQGYTPLDRARQANNMQLPQVEWSFPLLH